MKNYTDDQIVLITTGSQGEAMAALSRIAYGSHKFIKISSQDTVVFSSNPIPGNEKAVSNIINELYSLDAEVIFHDVHVSGHACAEEIKLIYSLVRPKYSVPVHGEYKHLKAQAKLAMDLGMEKDNVFILSTGDVLSLSEDSAKVTGKVQTGALFVDGIGVGDVGTIVLRDRQQLSEEGIMIVVLALDQATGELMAGPDIVSRGFVYVRESEELIEEIRTIASDILNEELANGITEWTQMKTDVKDALSKFLYAKTKRKPMVLPVIMSV